MNIKISNSFTKAIETVFADKKSIIIEMQSHITVLDFNNSSKILFLSCKRNYLIPLLEKQFQPLKDLIEKNGNLLISEININGKLISSNIIKPLSIQTLERAVQLKKDKTSEAISQVSNEDVMKNIFTSEKIIEDQVKITTKKLEFLNPYLEENKTLIYHVNDDLYKRDFVLAFVTSFLIITSIFFITRGIKKYRASENLIRNVNTLIVLNYHPNNIEAKKYIDKFIVK